MAATDAQWPWSTSYGQLRHRAKPASLLNNIEHSQITREPDRGPEPLRAKPMVPPSHRAQYTHPCLITEHSHGLAYPESPASDLIQL